ncbi:Hypothetical_protein [Hexamita inflata]|uniref:Hypothetical_protein n=1 Tax=Hexamita inflata TaxID=28002 RepID=A0AA86US75_9EUKA|nr:Hypothetical protein HINF_LOCUS35673 [Hexamita inflata]
MIRQVRQSYMMNYFVYLKLNSTTIITTCPLNTSKEILLALQHYRIKSGPYTIEHGSGQLFDISSISVQELFTTPTQFKVQKKRQKSLTYVRNETLGGSIIDVQLWEVELLFLVYYVSNYILKYFATSNADDKFQQIISSWRLFMNYSLTQEGQKYDFDRIRPQSTIQSRYLIFQKGKIEITTCNKRTAMTKINAVEDVWGRSTNSLNKLRQF